MIVSAVKINDNKFDNRRIVTDCEKVKDSENNNLGRSITVLLWDVTVKYLEFIQSERNTRLMSIAQVIYASRTKKNKNRKKKRILTGEADVLFHVGEPISKSS